MRCVYRVWYIGVEQIARIMHTLYMNVPLNIICYDSKWLWWPRWQYNMDIGHWTDTLDPKHIGQKREFWSKIADSMVTWYLPIANGSPQSFVFPHIPSVTLKTNIKQPKMGVTPHHITHFIRLLVHLLANEYSIMTFPSIHSFFFFRISTSMSSNMQQQECIL